MGKRQFCAKAASKCYGYFLDKQVFQNFFDYQCLDILGKKGVLRMGKLVQQLKQTQKKTEQLNDPKSNLNIQRKVRRQQSQLFNQENLQQQQQQNKIGGTKLLQKWKSERFSVGGNLEIGLLKAAENRQKTQILNQNQNQNQSLNSSGSENESELDSNKKKNGNEKSSIFDEKIQQRTIHDKKSRALRKLNTIQLIKKSSFMGSSPVKNVSFIQNLKGNQSLNTSAQQKINKFEAESPLRKINSNYQNISSLIKGNENQNESQNQNQNQNKNRFFKRNKSFMQGDQISPLRNKNILGEQISPLRAKFRSSLLNSNLSQKVGENQDENENELVSSFSKYQIQNSQIAQNRASLVIGGGISPISKTKQQKNSFSGSLQNFSQISIGQYSNEGQSPLREINTIEEKEEMEMSKKVQKIQEIDRDFQNQVGKDFDCDQKQENQFKLEDNNNKLIRLFRTEFSEFPEGRKSISNSNSDSESANESQQIENFDVTQKKEIFLNKQLVDSESVSPFNKNDEKKEKEENKSEIKIQDQNEQKTEYKENNQLQHSLNQELKQKLLQMTSENQDIERSLKFNNSNSNSNNFSYSLHSNEGSQKGRNSKTGIQKQKKKSEFFMNRKSSSSRFKTQINQVQNSDQEKNFDQEQNFSEQGRHFSLGGLLQKQESQLQKQNGQVVSENKKRSQSKKITLEKQLLTCKPQKNQFQIGSPKKLVQNQTNFGHFDSSQNEEKNLKRFSSTLYQIKNESQKLQQQQKLGIDSTQLKYDRVNVKEIFGQSEINKIFSNQDESINQKQFESQQKSYLEKLEKLQMNTWQGYDQNQYDDYDYENGIQNEKKLQKTEKVDQVQIQERVQNQKQQFLQNFYSRFGSNVQNQEGIQEIYQEYEQYN
ncbi:hypothetical protein PPERSA_12754 [Pseudocohnilembus persalinus]|uniref:Uncharacterized protein n=1 Tax=Pseudocohnilembus persalinus TaxID=266149 RepID=A0A0V0QUE6_PSEPJ|nr:hypothetical protein PPERSA_12754 [Pseudocohnilembus persalinus]|eukprot:KRX05576.1 hypothetical protein PPERSA_12754 [Pseudocohnilembus persalinus]